MEMIQDGIAEGLMETVRRDHREQGVPVIGREQPAKKFGAIDMPDLFDIAAQQQEELIRIDIHVPKNVIQFSAYIHEVGVRSLKLAFCGGGGTLSLKVEWCCRDFGQELFDPFIRNRLNDKIHFFRIVHILKVTELFPKEFLVVISAENVF